MWGPQEKQWEVYLAQDVLILQAVLYSSTFLVPCPSSLVLPWALSSFLLFLRLYLPSQSRPALLKGLCAYEPPGDLAKMHILILQLWGGRWTWDSALLTSSQVLPSLGSQEAKIVLSQHPLPNEVLYQILLFSFKSPLAPEVQPIGSPLPFPLTAQLSCVAATEDGLCPHRGSQLLSAPSASCSSDSRIRLPPWECSGKCLAWIEFQSHILHCQDTARRVLFFPEETQ